MTALDQLITAREYLSDPAKWAGNDQTNPPADPRYCACAATAIWGNKASETCDEAGVAFAEAIGLELPRRDNPFGDGEGYLDWSPIYDWNDAPERTHAEVLAAFDRAIEAVRV